MAQPKKKVSSSRKGHRRAHWNKLETPNLFPCPQCNNMGLPHMACPACGTYKGRQVIAIKTAKGKKKES